MEQTNWVYLEIFKTISNCFIDMRTILLTQELRTLFLELLPNCHISFGVYEARLRTLILIKASRYSKQNTYLTIILYVYTIFAVAIVAYNTALPTELSFILSLSSYLVPWYSVFSICKPL